MSSIRLHDNVAGDVPGLSATLSGLPVQAPGEEWTLEYDSLVAENERLRGICRSRELQITRLTAELRKALGESPPERGDSFMLTPRVPRESTDVAAVLQKVLELTQANTALVTLLKERPDQVQPGADRVAALEEALAAAENRLKAQQWNNDTLQQQLDTATKRLEAAEQEKAQLKAQIHLLEFRTPTGSREPSASRAENGLPTVGEYAPISARTAALASSLHLNLTSVVPLSARGVSGTHLTNRSSVERMTIRQSGPEHAALLVTPRH